MIRRHFFLENYPANTRIVTFGGSSAILLQGAISNLSNPKVAIFYFAYLPQFVSSESLYPTETLLALGVAFAFITFVVKVPIGYVAGAFSGWLQARPTVQTWLNRVSGSVLIGLGVQLAAESQAKNF